MSGMQHYVCGFLQFSSPDSLVPIPKALLRSMVGLKVAYFGSDFFSIRCLDHLMNLSFKQHHIGTLDLIAKHSKRGGRGNKQILETPIVSYAKLKQLNILRAEKNSEIESLSANSYDLAIAVSYGKLIPQTFLKSLRYGGLNVHPSLLPKYSGPAPLQHTILNGDSVTGVTVQALHPTTFDKGSVLKQEVCHDYRPDSETTESLGLKLADLGGPLLSDVVKFTFDNLILPEPVETSNEYSYAPKPSPSLYQINWNVLSTTEIIRRFNALGPLYTFKHCHVVKKPPFTGLKRVILDKISPIADISSNLSAELTTPGMFTSVEDGLIIKSLDGYIKVKSLKFQGFGSQDSNSFMASLPKRTGDSVHVFLFNDS
ncbi:Methionyl-tRNA formyltransferase, catalyzes the formylation of initiator Met-tRNA in mitochondria [Komagataella phaffii GS115]|uniref:methionyl-tRNA formyltransferase n=2 Tax=Komagataella phaffii TaxID=460519 RepID=C4QWF8_KOMPG|nr:Methionyl-tRNA formyltransferase, catalyzes the formylation of initiator Met-tRNA in mitochondria [Komagataella phaffii GS115]CAY67581.1 Methionyl-tRNA formyltransferase, catalyzes the formylation of initiator Met-tRNA in mitochondria [Komagataella phaffii GS115]